MPSDNGHEFNPFTGPIVTAFGQSNIASEMIGQDDDIKALFLTLTYFMDEDEAMDYADIIHKCEKYGMKEQKKRWLYRIAAKVSVKGYRSAQLVDVLTQIQRIAEQNRKERANQDTIATNRGIKLNA